MIDPDAKEHPEAAYAAQMMRVLNDDAPGRDRT